MYLTYDEYKTLGGTLDEAAFKTNESAAEYIINSQAGGKTWRRISKLEAIPEAVKMCVYRLVGFYDDVGKSNKRIISESQTLGGQSESVSYQAYSTDDAKAETDDIIYTCLYGGGYGWLLYRGVLNDD